MEGVGVEVEVEVAQLAISVAALGEEKLAATWNGEQKYQLELP